MKGRINLEDVLLDKNFEEDFLTLPFKSKFFKIVFIFILIIFIFFFFRLFYFVFVKGDYYQKRALANFNLEVVKLAPRGLIFDRFGKSLLENTSINNVYLNFSFFQKTEQEREEILEKISKILALDKTELFSEIKNHNWSKNPDLILKTDITQEELIKLSALNLKEIKIEEGFKRKYLDNFAFSHVLGYVGLVNEEELAANKNLFYKDVIGKDGLELYWDNYLRGENGKTIYLKNVFGTSIEKINEFLPKAGHDLKTFIDSEMQLFLYTKLKENLNRLNTQSGLVLVTNPQNGEVLSLISYPSYDLTNIKKYLNLENKPMFNRVTNGLYSPGSTIKPLVAVAALKEKIVTPSKYIYSAGYMTINNPYQKNQVIKFLDWKAHGWVNLHSALARSSNIYFYAIGGGLLKETNLGEQIGLGILRLKKWFSEFNLDKKTEIDLPFEKVGFLPDPAWKKQKLNKDWYLGDTYNVSIGQGDLVVTPVALLNYINAIANGGKFYKLNIAQNQPKLLKDLSNELQTEILEVKKGMIDAVYKDYGTAHLLSSLPLKIAAKTGSAQVFNNQKTNALFVGFAPYDNPQVSILILIENAKQGSSNTLPLAYDFFNWYLQNRLKR